MLTWDAQVGLLTWDARVGGEKREIVFASTRVVTI